LRLLTGLGLGVLLPLATTYINELAPRRVANAFALWGVALGWAAGGTLAGVVGVFATPLWGWQSLYWIGSLSFLLLPFMHLTLPESPKFLAINGRVAEIRKMLAKLRPERAHIYATATIAAETNQASGNLILELLQPRYRSTTIAIWATAFLSLFCIFGLSGWIPTVMIQRGETFAASFGFGALMQIMSFVGSLVLGHLVDAAGFFIIGAQFVLNNFTAAAYETNVRATAVGMELSVGRVGAILGPFVAGALQQNYQSSLPMFISIGAAALAAGGIILLANLARVAAGSERLAEPSTA
jgi:AAHS family 4-hydroxybenzoate transporter-like MFS transporter